jgi:hypothetical protein
MNFILVLLVMPLICGAIALGIVAQDRAKESDAKAPRRPVANARGFLLRSLAFLPLALILSLLSGSRPASAQEIIHGRAGQVVGLDTKAKTITIRVADGSNVVFHDVANPEPAMAFDKEVRGKTVPASAFHTLGAYVVVFYFGFDAPTAVAVGYLGPNPPKRTLGSVVGFDRHKHLLTLKTETAQPQELAVSDDTIVDTPEGIVKPAEFHPSKGEQLRCFAKPESQAALFVAPN